MRWKVWILATSLVGCDTGDGVEGGTDDGGSTTMAASSSPTGADTGDDASGPTSGGTSGASGVTSSDPMTGTTTFPNPTTVSAGDEESSSSGEPLPEGPWCSVQVTTHGVLTDPLPRGEIEGAFPPVIADALEDWCGCHTLENNAQNVQHEGLRAPSGTLFQDYADMNRASGGGTFAQALAQAIADYSMPPGSCSFPADAQLLLEEWFAAGAPDGANYPPP